MNRVLKLLLIEDQESDVELFRRAMRNTKCELIIAHRLEAGLETLKQTAVDVVLLDLSLPDASGYAAFERVREAAPEIALIVLTGRDDEALALRTIVAGAQDYLVKGKIGDQLLARSIRYAVERKEAQQELAHWARLLAEQNMQMDRELLLAGAFQRAFLPRRYPQFPAGVDPASSALGFHHVYLPAGPVGGDFLHVEAISDTEAGILMCDVMGHGVVASLVTAMLQTIVHDGVLRERDPARVLQHFNATLLPLLTPDEGKMFVSACYVVMDLDTGMLRCASAGHPAPALVRAKSRDVLESLRSLEKRHAPALGLEPEPAFPVFQTTFDVGDRLFMFTDGLYEVEREGGEPFTQDQLLNTILKHAALERPACLEAIVADVRGVALNGRFSDDLCLMVADVLRPPSEMLSVRTVA